jgi:hypothetical protein
MRNKQRLTPLRLTALAAALGIAFVGYSGSIATKPRTETPAAIFAPAAAYQDPSIAGLRPGPDADAGGDVTDAY